MRVLTLICLAMVFVWLINCESGDQPEYVEVPSGDPQKPGGGSDPVQDELPADESACAGDAAATMDMPFEEKEMMDRDDQGPKKLVPRAVRDKNGVHREIKKKKVNHAAMMMAPLALALLWRRRKN